jgi:PDZ domain-containing protein
VPARRSFAHVALLVSLGLLGVAAAGTYLLRAPSESFVFTPDSAHLAGQVVSVEGATPPAKSDEVARDGIYYLDVLVHRASIAESWLAPLERGSTLVPAMAVLPPGGGVRDEQRVDRLDISDSKLVAEAVAFRALHIPVSVRGGGARIDAVASASARKAGLAPGMVIVAANGKPIASLGALRTALAGKAPGAVVTLAVLDGTKHRSARVRLSANPSAPKHGLIGIEGEDAGPTVTSPRKVAIDTGNLGGPSAGLAFSLELYDALTKRSLSHGRRIAVTGALSSSGGVLPIGGMTQKAISAARIHADVLLVPLANLAEARHAEPHLHIVGVRTFAQALKAIQAVPATAS